MFRSHEAAQLKIIFNRERETHNQVRSRELSVESFSHNRIKNVINIEDNLFLKKQADKYNETSTYTYNTFISSENEIEVDHINSMSMTKKLEK